MQGGPTHAGVKQLKWSESRLVGVKTGMLAISEPQNKCRSMGDVTESSTSMPGQWVVMLQPYRALAQRLRAEHPAPPWARSCSCSCLLQATDHAQDASMVELDVQPGDIVVAGSDGLWDNLPLAEILDLLPQSPEQAEQVLLQPVLSLANEWTCPNDNFPASLVLSLIATLPAQHCGSFAYLLPAPGEG